MNDKTPSKFKFHFLGFDAKITVIDKQTGINEQTDIFEKI